MVDEDLAGLCRAGLCLARLLWQHRAMSRPRRSERQLSELVENPGKVLTDPEYWSEPICRRWLDRVDEIVHFDLRQAQIAAVSAVRLALRVIRHRKGTDRRNRSILALAYAVLGSTCRAAGRLDKAKRYLGRAMAIAGRCCNPDDRSEIYLRRAILTANLAQKTSGELDAAVLQQAVQLSEAGVRCARGSVPAARAMNARGTLSLYSGCWVSAAEDARCAIKRLEPGKRPYDHIASLSLLVNALAKGEESHRQEAAQHLEQLRAALPPRCPAIRARFLWAEGLLYFHNRQRKARARRRLDQARRKFIGSCMDSEAAAVTADLARHDPTGAVPRLCADLLPILKGGAVRDLVCRLERARIVERVGIAEELRSAIRGPKILPALAG